MTPRAWQWALFVALFGVAYLMLTPAVPGDSLLANVPAGDKLAHAALFALLGALARPAYPEKPRWGILLALALYAVALELGQGRVEGRSTSALDALAGAFGAALALGLSVKRRVVSRAR